MGSSELDANLVSTPLDAEGAHLEAARANVSIVVVGAAAQLRSAGFASAWPDAIR